MVTTTVEKAEEALSVENGMLVFPSSESFQTFGNTSSFNVDLYDFESLNEGDNNSDISGLAQTQLQRLDYSYAINP